MPLGFGAGAMVGVNEELELERLEKQVEGGGGGVAEYLALVRKLKVRRSSIVAKHGLALLNKASSRSKLGADGMYVCLYVCSFVSLMSQVCMFDWEPACHMYVT